MINLIIILIVIIIFMTGFLILQNLNNEERAIYLVSELARANLSLYQCKNELRKIELEIHELRLIKSNNHDLH
jgi:hypothetical protein